MGVDVVVVESDEPEESTTVAVAEAVTPGELAARLELLESQLGDRINAALEQSWAARAEAQEAQETAEVAAVVAAVAAEEVAQEADEEAEAGAEDDEGGTEGGEGDGEEDGVRPPEKRTEQAQEQSAGGQAEKAKKPQRSGYGASFLSGR
jgi:hypothetical protein